MTVRRSIIKTVTAAVFTLGIAATAQAGSISLDGYNLDKVSDVDRLHREIVVMARDECMTNLRNGPIGIHYNIVRRCYEKAVNQTIAEADIPLLSDLHASIDEEQRYLVDRPSVSDPTLAKD